ncbi:hypothetical protein CVV43_05255 [Candidatus Saccharibacteria bacterium HGW-Saccharibacteria-1]|jgi:hypothetical protein|nr:MAG: hypothetical protein CVV43_05255 [Candidatus Saccharibacteria bacterium HGW-Saccharibacteria-1]
MKKFIKMHKKALLVVGILSLVLIDIFVPIGKITPNDNCYFSSPRHNVFEIFIVWVRGDNDGRPTSMFDDGVCSIESDKIYLI